MRIHVFVITHHNVHDIDYWLGNKKTIGLCAETGFCFRMPTKSRQTDRVKKISVGDEYEGNFAIKKDGN